MILVGEILDAMVESCHAWVAGEVPCIDYNLPYFIYRHMICWNTVKIVVTLSTGFLLLQRHSGVSPENH